MRSRSVVDFKLESNRRARASFTRVMAAGSRSSMWRSMRSSSFSQSLMARKAMREELVSRSRTLKAASRAMRHAFKERFARSSGLVDRARAGVGFAGRGVTASCSASDFRIGEVLRGIELRKVSCYVLRQKLSLFSQYERTVTTLSGLAAGC